MAEARRDPVKGFGSYSPILQPGNTDGHATDSDLVQLAQGGHVEAYAELMRRTHDSCFRMAVSFLGNAADAEEQVQAAYYNAFLHIQDFEGRSSFSTWVHRIVMNECRMHIRRRRRLRPLENENRIDTTSCSGLPSSILEGPESLLGRDELISLVREEAFRLPPVLRRALVLVDLENISIPAAAEQMHLSVPALKSRLFRARRELRERILRRCGIQGTAALVHALCT